MQQREQCYQMMDNTDSMKPSVVVSGNTNWNEEAFRKALKYPRVSNKVFSVFFPPSFHAWLRTEGSIHKKITYEEVSPENTLFIFH